MCDHYTFQYEENNTTGEFCNGYVTNYFRSNIIKDETSELFAYTEYAVPGYGGGGAEYLILAVSGYGGGGSKCND